MRFVNQLYYLPSACEVIPDAVASPKDYGQALQNSVTMEGEKYRVRIGRHSFGRYNTLEEAIDVAKKERKNIFPLSSE